MNIQGGGISFEIGGTNDKLLRVLEQSKRSMQDFTSSVKKGGGDIDAAFDKVITNISNTRAQLDKADIAWTRAMDDLKQRLEEVNAAREKAWISRDDQTFGIKTEEAQSLQRQINAYDKLGQQIREAFAELDAEEASVRKQYEQAKNVEQAHASIRTQLRQCREELAIMEQEGKRGTEAYRKMQEEAGRLTDALGDAQAQAKILAHDNQLLQGTISAISGVAGAFTAAQGAVALFAGENENLQKIMLKVQSLMSITMGLQQVANTLNKDSAFQLTIVARAKDMLTAANARLATALGISTAAAQALMATLTLGLSAAITAIIVLISKMQSDTEKAKKEADEFNEKVAAAAGKPLAAYAELQAEWLSLTNDMKAREAWVASNAKRFEELGLKVYDAKTAENVLVAGTEAFVNSCIAKAKALAAQQIAAEKYEEILKKQAEIEAMPDKVQKWQGTGSSNTGYASGQYITVDNEDKKDAKKELETMKKEAEKFIDMQMKFSAESQQLLEQLGNAGKDLIAGSVEAAEAELSRLQTLYRRATTDSERKALFQKIQKQQEEVNRISLKSKGGGSGSGSEPKDPFADMLNLRKTLYAQYSKWVQSEDETVRKAAATEFKGLLQEGSSYIDYLEKQRAAIEGKASKTATDLKNLATINNEIAEATNQTLLKDFETALNQELAQCNTISARLALLEQRRKQLTGDNSDVDNGKSDIIDKATDETKKQAKAETESLLQEYARYLNDKIVFDANYARRRELLEQAAAKATTENEKAAALAALEALEKQRKDYAKRSGSETYDLLLGQYKTYQQKLTEIQQTYEEQRQAVKKAGNLAMLGQINSAEQNELSKLAAARLMASDSWSQLFSDLSTLSTSTINKLIADINSQKVTLSAQFNPADLKAINDQLEKAKEELHSRNPFLALRDSLRELRQSMATEKLLSSDDPFVKSLLERKAQYEEYTKAINSNDEILANASREIYAQLLQEGNSFVDYLNKKIAELQNKKVTIGLDVKGEEQLQVLQAILKKEQGETKTLSEGLKASFESVGSSIDFVKGCFDSVISGMEKMGITMDEETETILNDIGGIMDGASNIASGIATGNPLSVIQGSIGLISNAFDLFNGRDRKAERAIKKHEEAVTKLGRAYTALEHAVDKALGETVYQNQSALISNLRQQQAEIEGMIREEEGKKHTDQERIDEWREQIAAAGRQIEDIMDEITASITQTTAGDLANTLADALVEAFESGEDAAEAFGDVANDVLKNAVKNALKLQFLEKPLQAAIKQLQHDMGFNDEGNGTFNGLTASEQARFKDAVAQAGANFQQAMEVYKGLFDQLEEGTPSTLSGALKTASQESIDLLAGQTNAVRMNQVTALAIFREQLQHLSNMDNSLGVISARLLTIINQLTTPADNGLRGQGITT